MDSSFSLLTICAAAIGLFFTLLFIVYRKFRFHPLNEIIAYSSSSPASVSPSSSSPDWKHDFFPSLHWEDSGRSFFIPILKEFRRKGIIQKSKSIDSNLTETIRGSRIAVVILSRNYASSSLYLNELVEIMKCREELGQVVVPIFYKLDPIDVKTQSGDFGEVFKKTCAGKTNENIEIWSQALEKIATIAGYHSRNWDNEVATIKTIATDISHILKNFTPSSDLEGIISDRLLHTVYIYSTDTLQYSFASHLSMGFRRKGISAFVNCNEALEVIEGASAFVVVFSKNCFSSTSYQEKLVRVLQCERKKGHLVVPVFYGVSPSDVVVPEQESADWIREWSSAIQELRELPGHHSREECSESELVEEIVKDVYEQLFPMEQIGINSRLLEIEQLLCKQPWGIRRIGIWGMPGIGKTTLAKAFFDQIYGGYEASCFIKHFDKTFHENGLHHLLEEHFGEVLKELPRVCSSITRPSLPGDRLSKKRTLVVLDDVQNPLVAESFLGGFHWFGPGSLIVITSRDKQVFRFCQINHVYEVQSLNEKEALQLFSQRAFLKNMREQNLLKLSMKVIDYANGNPLALSFYDGELKGKGISEMKTTFHKFKICIPYKIHELFKSSYETLDENEKNIFLDIACFFNGDNVDYVMPLLEGCGFFPHVGIDVLMDKCLVTISESRVKMHRIIQDFGREIINGETVQIERRRRLWEPWTIKFLLEDDELEANGDPKPIYTRALGTEDIEGISLDTTDLLFDVKPTAFENMHNLRLLKIYCSTYESHCGLRLPKGLESLPYELRLLHWQNYPLQSLPQDFDPCHLVELNMSYSQLRKLWGGTKNLEMLKIIKLDHSQQLTEIDDICKAQNIELIDLQGCTELESFPATGHLQRLRVVNLTGCIEISSFPEVSSNIEELHLGETSIRELPISIGNATNLKELYLTRCSSLVELPASIGNATNLEILDLRHCFSLVELPSTLGNVTNLKELHLTKCSSLVELPASIGNAINLEILDLRKCTSVVELPSSIGNATNLWKLSLEDCSRLGELPVSLFGKAMNLKELYLGSCSSLVELPASIGNAINLEKLDLSYCSSLVELPASIGNATNLQTLDLSNCSSLKELPSTIGNATNLKELYLSRCSSLVEVPESIGNATNLQKLNLMFCSSLVKLPVTFWNATNLRVVNLSGCREIKSFPEVSPNIEELHLQGTGIRELPISILSLSPHDKLNRELSKLITEFSSISNALNDERLTSLAKVVSSNQHLGKLVFLNMKDCSQLRSLPHMVDLVSLRVLHLSGCSQLKNIQGLPRNLKELYLAGIAVEELPQLPQSLVLLNAHGCLLLKSIPFGFEQLPRYYTFSDCFALSAQAVSEFVVNALANVERMAREYQQEQELNKSLAFSFTVPSPANKKFTLDLQPGSSVMMRLDPSWRSTLVGFSILVEVAFLEDYHEASDFDISCLCRWKDKEGVSHRLENTFLCWTPGEGVPKFQEDHLFVFCDINLHPSSGAGKAPDILADLVVFEFFPVNKQKKLLDGSCTVTKCGVYVITDGKGDTSLNMTQLVSPLHCTKEVSDNEAEEELIDVYHDLENKDKILMHYILCLFNDEETSGLAELITSIGLEISSGFEVLADKSLIHISPCGVIVSSQLLPELGRGVVRGSAWPSTLPDSSKDLDRNLKQVLMTSSSSHNQKRDNQTTMNEIVAYDALEKINETPSEDSGELVGREDHVADKSALSGSKSEEVKKVGISGLSGKVDEPVEHPKEFREQGKYTMWQTLFEMAKKYAPIKPIGGVRDGVVCYVNRETDEKIAIKKIINVFENRINAVRTLRNMNLLRHVKHDNIIALKDVMLSGTKISFQDVHMVYELMDTDLHRIIKSSQSLSDDHCKFFLFQLLRGLEYLHSVNILHGNLKPGNLLLNANCDLKICDFGLARTSVGNDQFMTESVVTHWYQAPELLLGCNKYGTSLDIWSVGCILAEILGRKPIFPGTETRNQLKLIINVLGSQQESDLQFINNPNARMLFINLPGIKSLNFSKGTHFSNLYPEANPLAIDLLQRMLVFNPTKRITVIEALLHPYMEGPFDCNSSQRGQPARVSNILDIDENMEEHTLREMMWNEMLYYHPEAANTEENTEEGKRAIWKEELKLQSKVKIAEREEEDNVILES